ncbi:hypothetical protein [Halocatena salina]|uniref:Uncharacterized protein n=1 Tax=Halocatena salina TaxID=2934340 RepID=A0A8U0A2E6_9EURY|nr:hypothetical protein [Halocatena salina]UPM42969.1 hypothetical protein MW046_00595 [Halocatena salina]
MTKESAPGTSGIETGTSYFGVRDRRHVERDLDRFVESGLNAVLHTFSEADREYYQDTMARIVTASHDRDLTVYVNPWAVGRVFGGEALSEFIGRHPDQCQVMSTGDRVGAACFNAPRFRSFMREWTRDAADLGADVLFWDEPHWYIPAWHDTRDQFPENAWSCRCTHCRTAYREQFDEPMPVVPTERIERFREQSLLSFLTEMMEVANDRGARNAVCLLPSEDSDHGLRNWSDLAEHPLLDVLSTDPYWAVHGNETPAEFVGYFADMVASLARTHNIDSQIWIQGFRLEGGENATEAVRTATRTAIDSGVDSVFMWGYDACRSISSIACERPDAVWSAYLEELP